MDKSKYIEYYIHKCDVVIEVKNIRSAELLQDEIIGIFENEINEIRSMLTAYNPLAFDEKNVDYIRDIELLKQKLTNYYYDLEYAKEKRDYELELAKLKQPKISAYAESNPNQSSIIETNIIIDFEHTIEKIDRISKNELSADDQDELKKLVVSLEAYGNKGNKKKSWEIAKGILMFIADKSVDVAIATLPFVVSKLT